MTSESKVVTLDDEDDIPRRYGPEFWVLTVVVVVMLAQAVFLVSFVSDLRQTQDSLVCQSEVTKQLRTAAEIERAGQRALLNTRNDAGDSIIQQAAVEKYLTALNDADKTRADVPQCPPISETALATYKAAQVRPVSLLVSDE